MSVNISQLSFAPPIGFVWQGFGSGGGGGYRGGFCQKLLEASPVFEREPIPAVSKTDPPPAKAEPISDRGSDSVMTYLRREKSCSGHRNFSWRDE